VSFGTISAEVQVQPQVIVPPHVQLQEAHAAFVQQQNQMREMLEANAQNNPDSDSSPPVEPAIDDSPNPFAQLDVPQIELIGDDNNNDRPDDVNNNTTDPQLQQIQQQQQQEHLLFIQEQQRQARLPERQPTVNVNSTVDNTKKETGGKKKKKKKKKKHYFVTVLDSDGTFRKEEPGESDKPNENGIGDHDENDQPEKEPAVEIE